MIDIIERAEEMLRWTRTSATHRSLAHLVPELVSALKAARDDNRQLLELVAGAEAIFQQVDALVDEMKDA